MKKLIGILLSLATATSFAAGANHIAVVWANGHIPQCGSAASCSSAAVQKDNQHPAKFNGKNYREFKNISAKDVDLGKVKVTFGIGYGTAEKASSLQAVICLSSFW